MTITTTRTGLSAAIAKATADGLVVTGMTSTKTGYELRCYRAATQLRPRRERAGLPLCPPRAYEC